MRNVPLVGVLIPFEKGDEEGERRQNAFENGLREFGWTNGQNVRVEYRWVGSNPDRIRDSAIELVGMKPDVILTSSALTLAPLQRQTSTIPIVSLHPHSPSKAANGEQRTCSAFPRACCRTVPSHSNWKNWVRSLCAASHRTFGQRCNSAAVWPIVPHPILPVGPDLKTRARQTAAPFFVARVDSEMALGAFFW